MAKEDVDKVSEQFPFLRHVELGNLGTAFQKLHKYQLQNYGTQLEATRTMQIFGKTGRWPCGPSIVIDAPDYEEGHIEEVNKEISQPPSRRRDIANDAE